MMVTPRLEHPQPLTFVPDVRYGEVDGKPLLLDVIAPQGRSRTPRPGGAMSNDADGPVERLFGGTVTERREMMRLASPITHVSPGAPPILIAHGTLDETVPLEQGERLFHALVRARCEVQFIPIEGV